LAASRARNVPMRPEPTTAMPSCFAVTFCRPELC
jgi:hypothetical protein